MDSEGKDQTVGKFFSYQARGFKSIHGGHGDIHYHNSWMQFLDFVKGFSAISRLADYFQIRFNVQQGL